MDRRISKTKKVIKDCFIQLIREKGFEKITVKDLTEKANINRGTFYLHYKDKYDLLEQGQNEILKEIEHIMSKASKEIEKFIPIKESNQVSPFLTEIYTHIGYNSDFMSVILGTRGNLYFQTKLKDLIRRFIANNITNNANFNKKILVKYFIEMVASIQIGVIQKWIQDGMKESPKEMAAMVSEIIISLNKSMF
jgi:AcrR family transcriptional regulator